MLQKILQKVHAVESNEEKNFEGFLRDNF